MLHYKEVLGTRLDDIFNALRTMDTSKATRADNISPKILKIAAPYISNVVAKIFNASYKQGHFPLAWKMARVTSLYKEEDSEAALYADDTKVHASAKDIDVVEEQTNRDLTNIATWWKQNGLISNHKKCEAMLIGSRYIVKNTRKLQVILDGNIMKQTEHFKDLGVYVDNCLPWNKHVTYIQYRVYSKLKLLNRISSFLSRNILLRIYKQTVLPLLDYGCVIWIDCGKGNAERLERVQNQAMRIILKKYERHVHKRCVLNWFYYHFITDVVLLGYNMCLEL